MAVLTVAKYLAITDALAAIALAAKGASTAGIGDNDVEEPDSDVGARGRAGDLNLVLASYAEDDYFSLMAALRTAEATMGYQTWVASKLATTRTALNAMCVAAGLTGVASETAFATYYNYGEGGAWTCLTAPDYGRGVYKFITGANMEARNVYSPAITDMAHKVYNVAMVAGTAVDTTKYAGAAVAKVTGSGISGSGLVVVTGNGRDANGVAVTGRTWTATVSGNSAYTLTPATTGDILTQVTAMSNDAGITAGTMTVGCFIPAGRSNPPS